MVSPERIANVEMQKRMRMLPPLCEVVRVRVRICRGEAGETISRWPMEGCETLRCDSLATKHLDVITCAIPSRHTKDKEQEDDAGRRTPAEECHGR